MNLDSIFKKIQQKQKEKIISTQTYRNSQNSFHFDHHSEEDRFKHDHSIGLLNQLPNTSHNQNYFKLFFSDIDNSQPTEGSLIEELVNIGSLQSQKLNKIQNQLNDIEEMKNRFEKKKKHENNASVQKHCSHKSGDRHTLKPSQIPKISRKISEFSSNLFQNIKDSDHYTFKNEKTQNQPSQLNNSFQQLQPNHYLFQSKSLQSHNSKASFQVKPNVPLRNLAICQCDSNLQGFMTQIKQKMTYLSNKITQMSESNIVLKKKHEQITDYNIKLMQDIQKINSEKQEYQETQEKWQKSKDQLQNLLKNVLEKKQSKNNRQNMNIEDCSNYFKKKQLKQMTKNVQQKKNSSKTKVQNLLQRLHIRVQKS